jgi:hypothetical protein
MCGEHRRAGPRSTGHPDINPRDHQSAIEQVIEVAEELALKLLRSGYDPGSSASRVTAARQRLDESAAIGGHRESVQAAATEATAAWLLLVLGSRHETSPEQELAGLRHDVLHRAKLVPESVSHATADQLLAESEIEVIAESAFAEATLTAAVGELMRLASSF